jgi:hypothetical protein
MGHTKMFVTVKPSFPKQGLAPNTVGIKTGCRKFGIKTVRSIGRQQNVCGKYERRVKPNFVSIWHPFWF